MAIGIDLFVPNTFETFYNEFVGIDASCCEVCMRSKDKLYCPKLFCKWRDKKYSDLRKRYGRE